MTIEHIVLCGGGNVGLLQYGILKESNKARFWNLHNLRSIYATSAGSIIAVFITMGYEWDVLDNYLINRPWHKLFDVDFSKILQSVQNRGIFNRNHFVQLFDPLLKGKNLATNITLKEFYEYSGVDLHVFSVDMNEKCSVDVDFSHKTHPDVLLIDAVYCSSSIPGIFSPILLNNGSCYVDGYVFKNFPLNTCLNQEKCSGETVFAINRNIESAIDKYKITPQTNNFELIMIFLMKITERMIGIEYKDVDAALPYLINIQFEMQTPESIIKTLGDRNERISNIERGNAVWCEFYDKLFVEAAAAATDDGSQTAIKRGDNCCLNPSSIETGN
jgi:predicted acylesterase/phospholipase RssA